MLIHVFDNSARQYTYPRPKGGRLSMRSGFIVNFMWCIIHMPHCVKTLLALDVLVLIHHSKPSRQWLIGSKFILQCDDGQTHTVRVLKNYLQRQQVLQQMVWPPQSHDPASWSQSGITWWDRRHWGKLNPHENCGKFCRMPSTLTELKPIWEYVLKIERMVIAHTWGFFLLSAFCIYWTDN